MCKSSTKKKKKKKKASLKEKKNAYNNFLKKFLQFKAFLYFITLFSHFKSKIFLKKKWNENNKYWITKTRKELQIKKQISFPAAVFRSTKHAYFCTGTFLMKIPYSYHMFIFHAESHICQEMNGDFQVGNMILR